MARGKRPSRGPETQLRSWLGEQGLPVDEYGQGEAKTVGHLLRELDQGECRLDVVDGRVERTIIGAHLVVRHLTPQGPLRLVEDRQVFRDGRVRRRQLTSSIGEKMGPEESPDEAARRALKEELGIDDLFGVVLEYQGLEEKLVESTSYPGLVSRYKTHLYHCLLPYRHFDPAGYVEHQEDKISYWVWQKEA